MTDSPLARIPMDASEQPILDRLLEIRDHLTLLKQDRSSHIKRDDVMRAYHQVMEQVELLHQSRPEKREERSRVDNVVDDCFQLISLFFLTIGQNSQAPAIYSAISTLKRLLDHLKEAGFYSHKDLESIHRYYNQWQESIERGRGEYSEYLLDVLKTRLGVCGAQLKALEASLSRLNPETMSMYEKMVSILRTLSACNCRSKYPAKEVEDLHAQLLEIQAHIQSSAEVDTTNKTSEQIFRERMALITQDANEIPDGQTVLKALLARCLIWVDLVQDKKGKVNPRFEETYDQLLKIRNVLEQMNLTHAWSLRETDLYTYQRKLDLIDDSRKNGYFIDENGKPADLHANRTLLYLLRKSYAFIYQYIVTSEPVSEALLPIYNQLLTLKRCLLEVKHSGGVDSPRELYPYSMKLHSIDNMRKDGKFIVGGDIPEGQGSVVNLLAECFDLAYELRNEADMRSEPQPVPEDTNGVGVKG